MKRRELSSNSFSQLVVRHTEDGPQLPQLQRQQHKVTPSILERDSQASFKHSNSIWTQKPFHPTKILASCPTKVKVVAVILTTGFYILQRFQKTPTYCGSWDVAVTLPGCLFLILRLSSFPIQNISQDETFKKFLYIRYTALPPGSVDLKPFFQGLYTRTL